MVDFELTEDGPVHLVVGGAGNREGHAGARRPVDQPAYPVTFSGSCVHSMSSVL